MAGNIQGKSSVLKVFLSRRFGHVQIDSAMRHGSFNIEVHVQMLHTSLVRLQPACNRPVPRPSAV